MINEIMDNFKLQILNYVILDEKTGKINHKETKVMFKKIISKMFEKKFDKRPIVLTSIIEIDIFKFDFNKFAITYPSIK